MIGSLLYRTQVLQWYCNTVRLTNAQRLAFWSGFILVCVSYEGSGANSWADADIDRKSQNKREKFFLNLHIFRKNNFTLVSTYIFPNTDHSPCFPLGSLLLIHNFFKALCIFYWERLLFLHLTKAFSHFFFVTTWNWWLIFSFSVLHLWCLTETLAANRSPVFLWFSLFAVADPYPDPATWLLMTDPNVSGDMIKWEQNGVWIYDSLLKEKWWTDKLFSCQTWDLRLLKLANITE